MISAIKPENCVNFDKAPSPFHNEITQIVDIRNMKSLKLKHDFSAVVLLAAEHKDNIKPHSLYYDVNVEGTKNVLQFMTKNNINKLIFTSSVAIYGLNKSNPQENFNADPFNHYGKSKHLAEEAIRNWYASDKKNKKITIIRPTVIFGERNRGNVYNLLRQISSGKFLMIGSGNNKKSMAYVSNVVSFIINRLKSENNNLSIYNYSDTPDFTMNELVSLIENKLDIKIPNIKIPYIIGISIGWLIDLYSYFTGYNSNISSVRIKKFCATTQFNSEKAKKVFKPKYSLSEGLEKTLEYEFFKKMTQMIKVLSTLNKVSSQFLK